MPIYRIKPSDPDCYKCGSEINQLHQQQFLLATTAVALFGVYAGVAMPRLLGDGPSPVPTAGRLFFVASLALLGVFLVFFFWSLHLRWNAKIIALWLEETGSSAWERDIGGVF